MAHMGTNQYTPADALSLVTVRKFAQPNPLCDDEQDKASMGNLSKRTSSKACCSLQQLSAKELANLTWAIARANQSTSLSHALLGSIAIYAVEIMPQFEPHQLARLVHSYATLGYRSPELFDAANEQILDQLDCFATEDLSLIACANVSFALTGRHAALWEGPSTCREIGMRCLETH